MCSEWRASAAKYGGIEMEREVVERECSRDWGQQNEV